jgi:hypothetical protein
MKKSTYRRPRQSVSTVKKSHAMIDVAWARRNSCQLSWAREPAGESVSSAPSERNVSTGSLIVGRRHLEHVLRIYIQHYNRERPHRGLALEPPEAPQLKSPRGGVVQRRDRLGGLLHEYYRAAA